MDYIRKNSRPLDPEDPEVSYVGNQQQMYVEPPPIPPDDVDQVERDLINKDAAQQTWNFDEDDEKEIPQQVTPQMDSSDENNEDNEDNENNETKPEQPTDDGSVKYRKLTLPKNLFG